MDPSALEGASQDSQDSNIIHPSFIPELETVDLKAIRLLVSPKTKGDSEILDRVSEYLLEYNRNVRSIQTSFIGAYSTVYEQYKDFENKYNEDIYKYYKLSNTLLETIKSFKYFNSEIHKYSLQGGLDFLIDYVERVIGWVKDHTEECEYYFKPVKTIDALEARDFNKYKYFVNEVVLNFKDIRSKYVVQQADSKSHDDSVEFYDFENLVNLKTYYESLPNLLKKLSEIFDNEEIKKLCGDNSGDQNEENKSEHEEQGEGSAHQSTNSLIEDKNKDSVISLDTLENLRASLISKNYQELKQSMNTESFKKVATVNNTRLKSLDDSIQSINEDDLYKYNESLKDLNQEDEEESTKKPKEISTKRLWKFLKKHETVNQLIQEAKADDTLDKRIAIYEYKCQNRDMFDRNEIKVDDLFRLDMDEEPSNLDNESFQSSSFNSPITKGAGSKNSQDINNKCDISIDNDDMRNTIDRVYNDPSDQKQKNKYLQNYKVDDEGKGSFSRLVDEEDARDELGPQNGFFSRDGETLYEAVAKSGYLPDEENAQRDVYIQGNESQSSLQKISSIQQLNTNPEENSSTAFEVKSKSEFSSKRSSKKTPNKSHENYSNKKYYSEHQSINQESDSVKKDLNSYIKNIDPKSKFNSQDSESSIKSVQKNNSITQIGGKHSPQRNVKTSNPKSKKKQETPYKEVKNEDDALVTSATFKQNQQEKICMDTINRETAKTPMFQDHQEPNKKSNRKDAFQTSNPNQVKFNQNREELKVHSSEESDHLPLKAINPNPVENIRKNPGLNIDTEQDSSSTDNDNHRNLVLSNLNKYSARKHYDGKHSNKNDYLNRIHQIKEQTNPTPTYSNQIVSPVERVQSPLGNNMINININQIQKQGDDRINININYIKSEEEELPYLTDVASRNSADKPVRKQSAKRKQDTAATQPSNVTRKAMELYQPGQDIKRKYNIKPKSTKSKPSGDYSNYQELQTNHFKFDDTMVKEIDSHLADSVIFNKDYQESMSPTLKYANAGIKHDDSRSKSVNYDGAYKVAPSGYKKAQTTRHSQLKEAELNRKNSQTERSSTHDNPVVKKHSIVSNANSVVRKKFTQPMHPTSQTPTNTVLLNKSIENKRSTSNSKSKDKAVKLRDSYVTGGSTQTPSNGARYPVSSVTNKRYNNNVQNVKEKDEGSKKNNIQNALHNIVQKEQRRNY